MARIEKTVFISYRRTDVYTALAVYQDLTSKGYDVFFDYTSIPSGDFEQIIISNIRARAHFLLILTPTALDRCNEPGDWLRREIETAIDEKRNIIPLFFKGFKFGAPALTEKLTGKLANINRYNGLNVHEDYFHAAMDRLSIQFLNVPTSTILHPISTEVQEAVKAEQVAADKVVEEKGDIWEFIKSLKSGKNTVSKPNFRIYGIGVVALLVAALGFFGIRSLVRNDTTQESMISTPTASKTIEIQSPTLTRSTVTLTPAPTFTPTSTATLTFTPTLGIGSTIISEKDGMVLLYVPAGEFSMGSDVGPENIRPAHTVFLDSYWIDKIEVTNAMYSKCVDEDQCDIPDSKRSNTASRGNYYENSKFVNYPVIYVSWSDAETYCAWAGRRLLTEAEWEKAASWNDITKEKYLYPWGILPPPNSDLLNFNMKDTTEVGDYPDGKSPYKVLDMAGNVWEWVNDWYDENYYKNSRSNNPEGPVETTNKVMRGGGWNEITNYYVASTTRTWDIPTAARAFLGFRCAMDASK